MRSDVHWIAAPLVGRLAIMARPRAGEWLGDEIAGWQQAGIDIVVSLLEPDEAAELDLSGEAELCRASAIGFVAFPIPDRGVPAVTEAQALARSVARQVEDGKAVAIHCRAGIGRSSLMAACVLVCTGMDAATAFELIGAARGLAVPDTEEQRQWVMDFEG
jgi:predicted protein tyrosine phosphatase